ncbi:uncharacterized protein si:ch73-204p21.2 [Conger conger]|nr:uncharacterized protein si:ch73-204p21.2 [Conger conger]
MAPVGMQVLGWAAVSSLSPEFILASLIGLIALIKLLAVCTECNRSGFDVEERTQVKRSPSTLIRVVQMEDVAMSRENPSFEYTTKDEQGPSPTIENGSLHMSVRSGDVWYTPWRSHTINHQDHPGGILNHEPNPAGSISESPANNRPGIPTPSGAATIPYRGEVNARPPVPQRISSLPAEHPTEHVQPLWHSEKQEVNGVFPEGSALSLHQQRIKAPHTYESLEDMEAAITEETESSGYHTVEELNASTPHASDHSDVLSVPTACKGVEDGMMGMGLNGMYAQVSKRYKDPTQPLTVWGEPVPLPQLPLEEEEEPAPPVPYRNL